MQQDAMEVQEGSRAKGEHAAGAASSRSTTFKVTFGQKVHTATVPADSFKLAGGGSLSVGDGKVVLSGRTRTTFGKDLTHVVPLAAIANVQCTGKSVRFEVHEEGAIMRFAKFTMANEAQAIELRSLLPTAQTEAFVASQAELADFHRRLDTLSPHAPVTPVIVAINVIVFVAICIGGAGLFAPDGEVALRWGSNYGPLTMGGQWWRLLTSNYIHFGIIHIALNMWALYQSGRTAERLFGSLRYALLYFFAGIAGSVASLLWNPEVNSAGASGAIFGVFGGLLAFVVRPGNGVPQAVMAEQRSSTALFIIYSLFYGFAHGGVDNAGHVGGLIGGFGIGLLLARPLDADTRAQLGLRQLLVALLAGVVVLGAGLWPLAHPSGTRQARLQFQQTLNQFSDEEQQAITAINAIAEKTKKGEMTHVESTQALRTQVVPTWEQLRKEVSAPALASDDKDYPLQQALLSYVTARRDEYGFFADAEQDGDDGQALTRARAARQQGDAALERVKAIAAKR